MKKALLAVLLVVGFTAAYADDGIPMAIGFGVGYAPLLTYGEKDIKDLAPFLSKDTISTMNFPQNSLFVSFDAAYVRAIAAFSWTPLPTSTLTNTTLNLGHDNSKAGVSFINLSLLGKLPFEVAQGANLWFGAGIEYDLNLAYDMNGDGTNDFTMDIGQGSKNYSDLNDLYVIAGIGADIAMNANWLFTPSIIFGYNLTPDPLSSAFETDIGKFLSGFKMSDYSVFSGMKLYINLGLSYKL
jgi:hypothetical protein